MSSPAKGILNLPNCFILQDNQSCVNCSVYRTTTWASVVLKPTNRPQLTSPDEINFFSDRTNVITPLGTPDLPTSANLNGNFDAAERWRLGGGPSTLYNMSRAGHGSGLELYKPHMHAVIPSLGSLGHDFVANPDTSLACAVTRDK